MAGVRLRGEGSGHMLTRAVAVGGVVAAALLVVPGVARADGWGKVECTNKPTPHCALTAGTSATPQAGATDPPETESKPHGGGTGASGDLPACDYSASESSGQPGTVGWQPPASWHQGTCSLTGVIQTPGPQLSPVEVARLARAQLGLPAPVAAANPAGTQLVHLPTWLWLANGWHTVTATAAVPGVAVTATARPTAATWAMGDGTTVTCTGPGTAFQAGGDPRAASPDCGHTYRRSSAAQPGGRYAVAVSVHWAVTWVGAGQSGTFPEMTTTSATSFRVAESPALNILPGPR